MTQHILITYGKKQFWAEAEEIDAEEMTFKLWRHTFNRGWTPTKPERGRGLTCSGYGQVFGCDRSTGQGGSAEDKAMKVGRGRNRQYIKT